MAFAAANGKNGTNGSTVNCRAKGKLVTCKLVKGTATVKLSARARLTRKGVVYAKGTVAKMNRLRTIVRGRTYTLKIASGTKTVLAKVVLR